MKDTSFFGRYGSSICLLALFCLPLLVLDAKSALDSMTNDVADWLPEHFPETATVRWFGERFGGDAMMVISWPDCTLDDKRQDGMREALLLATTSDGSSLRLFRNVFTGRQALDLLQAPPVSLSRTEAIRRMKGWLVGSEDAANPTTCLATSLTRAGWVNRGEAVATIYDIARSQGIDTDELILGGPAVDSVAIDAASQQWLLPLLAACVLCALAISWYCLREVCFVVAVFFYAMFSWAFSLSVVTWSGLRMDAVLITMPALVYVLAVSAAVHMTGYYKTSVAEVGVAQAQSRTFRLGWAPCIAAAVTTAFGVGSLTISEVVPLRRFGIFASVGVLVAVVFLFVIWPAAVQLLSALRRNKPDQRSDVSDAEPPIGQAEQPAEQSQRLAWWLPLFHAATRHWVVVLLPIVIVIPLLGVGVSRIRTSVSLQDLFSDQSKIIQDYWWLETNIGPLIPVEVVLQFPEPDTESPYAMLERMQLTERMRRHVQQMPAIGASIAATTFLPKVPEGRSVRQTARRGVIARQMLENRDQLIDLQYLYDEPADDGSVQEELWRISGRVEALGDLDYGTFLEDFEEYLNQFIEQDEFAQQQNVSLRVSGGVFLVAMAQKQLLIDLKNSFLIAFLLIAVAMMVLTRSIATGFISMIPNLFPALLAFGLMGWLDMAVDVGTLMSASVALGISVDDASHFLIWLRRGLERGDTMVEAIRYAYRHCADAMLATSVICGFGILAFGLSPFMPVARFAVVMCILLFAALAGNLLLLAAMLASPLGRLWLRPKRVESAE